MAKIALAVKYRPKTFADVTEQDSIKVILQQQLKSEEFQHAYLFVGGAGTGKTTCARIFADEINKGQGNPIELDAASNSSVDDVRDIIAQSKLAPIDGGEYKIFIVDECHSLSSSAWQAFLKLIEEPPARSIFIFCTTNPEKIPKTILSRVQRFDYKRISQLGIVCRLKHIVDAENDGAKVHIVTNREALEYLAKLSEGGMRTAISLMDKCLSYSNKLTVENIVKALGVADYDTMVDLVSNIIQNDKERVIKDIEEIHNDGKDLKQFIKQLLNFVLDIKKYAILKSFDYIQLPYSAGMEEFLDTMAENEDSISDLLDLLVKTNSEIKYDSSPKYLIEAMLLGGLK